MLLAADGLSRRSRRSRANRRKPRGVLRGWNDEPRPGAPRGRRQGCPEDAGEPENASRRSIDGAPHRAASLGDLQAVGGTSWTRSRHRRPLSRPAACALHRREEPDPGPRPHPADAAHEAGSGGAATTTSATARPRCSPPWRRPHGGGHRAREFRSFLDAVLDCKPILDSGRTGVSGIRRRLSAVPTDRPRPRSRSQPRLKRSHPGASRARTARSCRGSRARRDRRGSRSWRRPRPDARSRRSPPGR